MIELYTDGSAVGKQGGWAYILIDNEKEYKSNGRLLKSGSNQMELLAVNQGLSSLPPASKVTVYTDSHYVITHSKKLKRHAGNLVSKLHELLKLHEVDFVKVKSGSHHIHNQVHHLAREAALYEVSIS